MNDKELLSEHGLFWLSENDERKLWGTLRINEINEARLETFGSLISERDGRKYRILGQIKGGQKYITLIDCFPINTQFTSMKWGVRDWSHQTYVVNQALEGILFEEGDEIAFEEAILHISTLTKWVNPDLVELDFSKDETRPLRVNISIKDKEDEISRVTFEGEEIKVSIVFRPTEDWGWRGVITKYLVEDNCFLAVEKADGSKMPLKSILSVTGAMLDLLSIGCNETPSVSGFSVHYKKQEGHPINVFVRMRGYNTEAKEDHPFPAISFRGIGGAEGIARWLEVTERYGAAVGLLTSNWFNDRAYNEDRFGRMYAAVESLLSRKKARNRASMKPKELAEFVEATVPGFTTLTNCHANDWAEKVKEIRDQKISHSDPASTVATNGRTMIMMTNLLYLAGASFLLREMGMEDQQIEEYVQGCYQSLLLSDQQ